MIPTIWTQDLVLDVFATGARWSPRGMPDEYKALAADLNQMRIAVEVVGYQPVDEPLLTAPPSVERAAWACAFSGTGGPRHNELKWWAWNWLHDQGEPHPQFEQPAGYGVADLVAPSIGYVAECGDTAPSNVRKALFDYEHTRLVLFPFRAPRGPYSAFIFQAAEPRRVLRAAGAETQSAGLSPSVIVREAPWLTDLVQHLAPSSQRMYLRDFNAYLNYAGSVSNAMHVDYLVSWIDHLVYDTSLSANTIKRMITAVKTILGQAIRQGYADNGQAGLLDRLDFQTHCRPSEKASSQNQTSLSADTVRALCEAPDTSTLVGTRDAALLATLASSGVRVSELISLRVAHIQMKDDGYAIRVQNRDGDYPREAPLSPAAYELIEEWLRARTVESEYVFTSFEGRGERLTAKALSAVGAWRVVQHYAETVGLDHVKPHDFRRFVGTELARRDIRQAQKALGHKRIDTTARHYILDELEPGLTDDLY